MGTANPVCRLHEVQSKTVLASILGIDRHTLLHLSANSDSEYRKFKVTKNGKSRLVEEPKFLLKRIHQTIAKIIISNGLPDYVYSGKKGFSYVDNGKAHAGKPRLTKMDIQKFYPSCSREFAYRYFRYELNTSPDVAEILANLLTYQGHIATGSPASQILSFQMHRKIFDRIAAYAEKKGYTFTLYVDDLCFSGESLNIHSGLAIMVSYHLKTHGLKLSRPKIVSYDHRKDKLVTGCLLRTCGKIYAPDELKRKVFDAVKRANGDLSSIKIQELTTLIGRLQAVRQVEGKGLYQNLYSNLASVLHQKQLMNRIATTTSAVHHRG